MSQALRIFDRHRLTGEGEHYWTHWGPWVPMKRYATSFVAEEGPPTTEPILAYRHRTCPCGALEQESYQGERAYWSKDDERWPGTEGETAPENETRK